MKKKTFAISRIWKMAPSKYLMGMEIAAKIFLTYAAIYVSHLAKNIVDKNIFLEKPVYVLVRFFLVAVLGIIASVIFQYGGNLFALKLAYQLRREGTKKILSCSYDNIEKQHSGAMINRLNGDVNSVSEYFAGGLPELIGSAIGFVCSVIYLLFVNWSMLLATSICIPITIWITNRLAEPTYDSQKKFRQKMDEVTAMARDTVVHNKVEYSYQLKDVRRNSFNQKMDEATAHYVEYERYVAKASPMRYLMNSAPMLICIMVGFINSYFGKLTGGEFVSFMLLLGNISTPLSNYIGYITDYKSAQVSMDRVMEILDLKEEHLGNMDEIPKEEVLCYSAKDICFSYETSEPSFVLENLSLDIFQGEMVAFAGASGCGKSTLFKLFAGFYTAQKGELSVFGRSILDWEIAALRSQIAYVEQRTYLFYGTVEDNIRAGNTELTMEQIVEAAKKAFAHEFIEALPEGYQTVISEAGNNFSGGQKQRLAIARAFAKNAPILLLDEMTAALDEESEQLIQKAIENYRLGRTIIIIAHRLSTIVNADRIFVMESGKVRESGSHSELLAVDGIYSRLYHADRQKGGQDEGNVD